MMTKSDSSETGQGNLFKALLRDILSSRHAAAFIKKSELNRVNVDSTVQEKAIRNQGRPADDGKDQLDRRIGSISRQSMHFCHCFSNG